MNGRLAFAAASGVAVVVFTLFPQIDLWFSGLFYRPDAGFFLGSWLPVQVIYRGVPFITYAIVIFAAVAALAVLLGRQGVLGCNGRMAAYIIVSLAIGPGLLANTVLKDHWGRARPSQVTEFGGSKDFTPALLPSAQCERNCSFVSGHAALGFYLVSLAFLVREARRRRRTIAAALALGGLFGLARIAQGGHFLSDVVFAGILVYATSWYLHLVVVVKGLSPPALPRRFIQFSALVGLAIALSIAFVDRPVAYYFHDRGDTLNAVFQFITLFGLSKWYLISAAILWLGLRLGSRLPPFAALAPRLKAWSCLPLYFFTAVAASGLATDLIKILAGRTRPKLLFAASQFAFTGPSFHADHWSFPSGHATNVVAIAVALASIWPRCLPVYVVFALLVMASRVIITAHYISDVIMGGYVAILVTCYVDFVFRQSGIYIEEARTGTLRPHAVLPWRERLRASRDASDSL